MRTFPTLLLLALATSLPAAEPEFDELFNGRDLSGWSGLPAFWSVEDAAITGRTTSDNPVAANTFLVWHGGTVADFELRLMFRLLADNDRAWANSGIQYRSRILDEATWTVGGYQADLDFAGKYIGMLYEEQGRGILMRPGERIRVGVPAAGAKPPIEQVEIPTAPDELAAAYRAGEWNEFTIVARGNVLRHYLNGVLTAEVTDLDTTASAVAGVLALQLHRGPPMTVQFKQVRLRALP